MTVLMTFDVADDWSERKVGKGILDFDEDVPVGSERSVWCYHVTKGGIVGVGEGIWVNVR